MENFNASIFQSPPRSRPASHPRKKKLPQKGSAKRRSTIRKSKTQRSARFEASHRLLHQNFASIIHITLNIHTTNQPTKKTSHPRKKQDESTRLLSVTTNIYYFFNYFSYQPTATSIIGCLTHPQNSTSDHRESRPRLIDSSECANNGNTHPPRFVCGASELLQNIHSSFTQKPPQQSRVRFRFSGTICY